MNLPAQKRGLTAIAIWLAFLFVCAVIISRSQFTTDLSAFLPRTPTVEQQLLMDQLRDGLVSRLILVGIEGTDAPTRARLSRETAQRLRNNPAFVTINNGEPVNTERDRAFLFDNRYLLSPSVTPERFSVGGLHAALSDSIDLLASPAGLLVKPLLPRDPTGEMVQLLDQIDNGNHPQLVDGAWASRDGESALMLAQTRASGTDIDAQQQAMSAIRLAFDQVPSATPVARLTMSGPGVFSVLSRDSIKSQVTRLSIISTSLIAALLLLVYRSFTALALGLLPVISGALVGIAAVSLGFGVVHGITLGFGTALIGEAVDYSIYLFVQSEHGTNGEQGWITHFWPTIRLGVLTSVFGFAALLLSGFPGLAQLGLYAIAGLVAAAAVTRFVLPGLLPIGFSIHDVSAIGLRLSYLAKRAASLRWVVAVLLFAACVILYGHRTTLWSHELGSLSPVSADDLALDARLRTDMGAPDARYLVVVSGASRESALNTAERVSRAMQPLVEQGVLAGFESPSRYLPSVATQQARQASLPPPAVLQARLQQATKDLPVRPQLFTPFVDDVAAARSQPLLQPADLQRTSMAMAVDALLIQQDQHWSALLPLAAPDGSNIDISRVRAALKSTAHTNALFVDLKSVSNHLYSGYLNQAILLSLGGLLAIVVLLLVVLRSPLRLLRIITPLVAAVLCVTAGLALFGQQLIILHLVGLLLVVAIGSNYALFFDQRDSNGAILPRTYASLLFANMTTITGFGLLAFSSVPVLQALGATVAPGVILALIFSAIFAKHPDASTH